MALRFVLSVAVLCALANATVFDPYSRRYGVCKSSMPALLNVSSGSSHCGLITGLYGMSVKANLTTTQNATFTAFVQNMETTIVNNASISNQSDKFNMIAAAFNQFSLDQTTIYGMIQYVNISTWGPPETLIRITNEGNFKGALQLGVQTDVHGNCKLFDLLLSACTDATKKQSLSAFIESDLKMIVKKKGMSQSDIVAAIMDAFNTKFFVTNPTFKSYFMGLKLKGFFAFSQFSAAAVTFKGKSSLNVTLAGSGTTCPFILALNATRTNSSYTTTQKGFIVQLINYFTQQWSTVTTMEARLNLISMKFSESCDLSYSYFGMLSGISIPGCGSFFDLIALSCQINIMPTSCGCPVPSFPDMMTTTEMMTTSTEMPSTSTMCSCKCEM